MHDAAAVAYRRRVVQDTVLAIDEANHGDTFARSRGEVFEPGLVVGDEPCLQHEVFRWITGQREFGECHEITAGLVCTAIGVEGLGRVALHIAHRRIDLSQAN